MKTGLDLSKFKKISSDEKTSVLKHADGHELRLAHSKMPPKLKAELDKLPLHREKMAEGGIARVPESMDDVVTRVPEQQELAQAAPAPAQDQIQASAAAPEPIPAEEPAPAPEPEVEEAPAQPAQEEPAPAAPPSPQATDQKPMTPADLFSQDKGDNLQTIAKEDAAVAGDLFKGHITPKTYGDLLGDKSFLGKMGSIFGLLVGGVGAGINHTENPVIKMWNQQINNDIEAQKQNMDNKRSLLSLNRQRFADLESAVNFTRMQQNRIALHSLAEQAAKLPPGSPEQLRAQQSLAAVGQFVNTENYNLSDQIASKQAFMKAMGGTGQNDEAQYQSKQRMLRLSGMHQIADENDKRHVPGVGESSFPLTQENRDTLQSKQLFNDRIQDFIDFSKKNSGSLDPRIIAIGKAKANELNGLYRNATHGGIYKAGEAEFINQVVDSNPTKFFNVVRGVIPKAQELLQSNMQSLNSYKNSLGLPARAAQAAQAQQLAMRGGVQYQKVPGGWKRVQ